MHWEVEQLHRVNRVPAAVLLIKVQSQEVTRDRGHGHVGVSALHAAAELVNLVELGEALALKQDT